MGLIRPSWSFILLYFIGIILIQQIKYIECQVCSTVSGQCERCPIGGCTNGTLCNSFSDCQNNLCIANKCTLCSYGCINDETCLTQNDCLHNVCEYGICARCTLDGCSNGNICKKSSDCIKATAKCNYK